jgi:hypothetical protein
MDLSFLQHCQAEKAVSDRNTPKLSFPASILSAFHAPFPLESCPKNGPGWNPYHSGAAFSRQSTHHPIGLSFWWLDSEYTQPTPIMLSVDIF